MAVINVILRNQQGDECRPLTNASQVEITEGGDTIATWIESQTTVVNGLTDLVDEDGKLKVSSLPDIYTKFKGSFTDSSALPETGEAGDYAICTDTDTVWVWDAEKEGGAGWIDTATQGSVLSVSGKTGVVTLEISDIEGLSTLLNSLSSSTESLQSAIATAQSTADNAASAASAAQTTADNAASAASAAQTTANDAASAASAAQSAAETAASAASAAQSTADEIDFAVVENGAGAPTNLRDAGVYFEKAAG